MLQDVGTVTIFQRIFRKYANASQQKKRFRSHIVPSRIYVGSNVNPTYIIGSVEDTKYMQQSSCDFLHTFKFSKVKLLTVLRILL